MYKSAEVQGNEVGTYVVSAENLYSDKDPIKLEEMTVLGLIKLKKVRGRLKLSTLTFFFHI